MVSRSFCAIAMTIGFQTGLASQVAAKPVLYGPEAQILIYSRVNLDKGLAAGFAHWKTGGVYFGAYDINLSSDTAFSVRGFHNFQDAIYAAKKGCQITSHKDPDKCMLYAAMTPVGFSGYRSDTNGISASAEKYFKHDYLSHHEKGRFEAFAISGLADFGASWGRPSKAEAEGAALQTCIGSTDQTLGSFNIKGREAAKKAGFDKCKIVDVRSE